VLVEEIMLPEVVAVSEFDLVADVVGFLSRRKIAEVLVVDLEQRPVGYFSASLFFRQLIESAQKEIAMAGNFMTAIREKIKEFSSQEISEFMNTDFDYLEADEDLEEALDLLLNTSLELIPVVRGGKAVGMISHTRFLQYFIEKMREVRKNE